MVKDLLNHLDAMAQKHGVPVDIARAVFELESASGKNMGKSSAGARGPMQLMPGTAKELGVNIDDPFENIEGGVRYLKKQLSTFGDPTVAVAAYNAGPGNVRKYGGIPPFKETQKYVQKFVNLVGAKNLMEAPKAMKPIELALAPKPRQSKPIDVASVAEEKFTSLLAGLGKKKRSKKAKPMGILAGLI